MARRRLVTPIRFGGTNGRESGELLWDTKEGKYRIANWLEMKVKEAQCVYEEVAA